MNDMYLKLRSNQHLSNSFPWRKLLKMCKITQDTIHAEENIHIKMGSKVIEMNAITNKDLYSV